VGSVHDDRMRPITGDTGMDYPHAGLAGAFFRGAAGGAHMLGVSTSAQAVRMDSGLLSPNHNGTETAPLHMNLTPAIYLGVVTPR